MGVAIPVIRFVADSGEIVKVYDNIKAMADIEEISLETAFSRTSKKSDPIYGEKFMFENDYIKLFPKSDYAKNPEKVKELYKMAKAKVSEKSSATEMELLNQPATEPAKKKPGRKKKEVPEQNAPKTKPAADIEDKSYRKKPPILEETVDNHPEFCEEAKDIVNKNSANVDCWDAMMSSLGPVWMEVYAHAEALKYILLAKQEQYKGRSAEYMRKAAEYCTKAAELEEENAK